MTINNPLVTSTTWTIGQIGSFRLSPLAHHQVRAALTIAKLMRCGDDGEVEDAVRAITMIKGAALFDRSWEELEVEDEQDLDNQIVAYMDGTQELMRVLGVDQKSLPCCGTEGGC